MGCAKAVHWVPDLVVPLEDARDYQAAEMTAQLWVDQKGHW